MAAFSLKKDIAIKKSSKSSIGLRFDDLISENSPFGHDFIFYFPVIHHFLGNVMLNSNLKSVFKKIKIE